MIRNQQLSTQQLADLDALWSDCKRADGNGVTIYKHLLEQLRPNSCNTLYYQQTQLIGYLSTFFFYEGVCEITLMVAPAFRRLGIATRLIKDTLPFIYDHPIKTLLFSMPNGINDHWLSQRGFCYQNSEFQMQRLGHEPLITTNKSLIVRPATPSDIPDLCAIDSVCFPTQQPDMAIRFYTLLQDPGYKLFIALLAGEPIGKVHLSWQQNNTRLTDIAILPQFQGCGFGSEMLINCINYCLAENNSNLSLDVETNNQDALRLYTRLGFIINNAYDFWTIPIDIFSIK